MVTIALDRCIGIVCSKSYPDISKMFSRNYAKVTCIMIWVITFLILCPTTFGVEGFGTFGYDPQHGKCEIKHQLEMDTGISHTSWYFLAAGFFPCLIIITSYIVLSLYIHVHSRNMAFVMANNVSKVSEQTQV